MKSTFMNSQTPAQFFLLLLTLGFIVLGSIESKAQAPSSLGGQAALLQVTSSTGGIFASTGSTFRFLPSATTDSSYGLIGLTGNAANSYGTYSYSKTSASTGTATFNDIPAGISGFVATFTFTTATTGSYSITNANYPGQLESGTFTLFAGAAPASVLGWTFQLQIDAGVAPYATNGTAQLVAAASGNNYVITAESGNASNSSGTYTYTTYPQNSSASSSLTLNDSVLGAEYTQTLSWQTSTSGAYVVRNASTGGYQTGTFTGTPPASPFTTTSDGNGGLIITGYSGPGGAIVIPATINGFNVTSIGQNAFENSSSVTSVSIPSSDHVTSIGSDAFYGCTNLTSVSVGSTVTSIGSSAFGSCSGLTSLTMVYGVTSIGNDAFENCSSLTSVTIPTSVTSIGIGAFESCDLIGITIPNSVTSIGQNAFYNCVSLTGLTIGSGVSSIGVEVFQGCTSLTSVTIPNNVTSIGQNAFENCTGLKSVTIPNTITSIGTYAFAYCGLTSVTIPNSVTSIASSAFESCALTSVTIPTSVVTIGQNAFAYCPDLPSVTIPTSVLTIGQSAFAYCTALTSVTIPNSVVTIGSNAFSGCSVLASVTIPASVSSISSYAFSSCADLTSAVFLGNAPTMGSYAFSFGASNFTVSYYSGATGFTSPSWTDSSGDTYTAQIIKLPQTITFSAIANQQYPSSSFVLNATATSGSAVTYSLVSGPATLSGTNNDTVTVTGTGTVVIQASQGGNANYLAATSVNQSFTVAAPVAFAGNPTAKPDNDGVANLLKYAFDIDSSAPMSATDYAALPTLGTTTIGGSDYLTLTYRQYALATGITVKVQTSPDLQTWTTQSNSVISQVSTDPNTGDPIMQAQVPVSGTTEFMRLDVTSP